MGERSGLDAAGRVAVCQPAILGVIEGRAFDQPDMAGRDIGLVNLII